MTREEIKGLETRLLRHIERLTADLKVTMPDLDHDKTHVGSWSNDNGLATAFLAYQISDIPTEDRLEVVFSLTSVDAGLNFSADIGRTDGEILASVTETHIVAKTPLELCERIDQLCAIAKDGVIQRLKSILLPA
jgi:hypothetical protein